MPISDSLHFVFVWKWADDKTINFWPTWMLHWAMGKIPTAACENAEHFSPGYRRRAMLFTSALWMAVGVLQLPKLSSVGHHRQLLPQNAGQLWREIIVADYRYFLFFDVLSRILKILDFILLFIIPCFCWKFLFASEFFILKVFSINFLRNKIFGLSLLAPIKSRLMRLSGELCEHFTLSETDFVSQILWFVV